MPSDPGCIGELEHDLHKAFAAARVPSEVRRLAAAPRSRFSLA